MKTHLTLALCLLATTVQAQERTASGALTTEASWAALKNLTEQANSNAKSAHIRLDQIEMCAKDQKLYSPSTTGADQRGCITPRGLGDYMVGTNATMKPAYKKPATMTLTKSRNMVVRTSCSTSASASNGSYGSNQVQFFVGSTSVLSKSVGCSASYGTNTGKSCSAAGTFHFMEEDGVLYAFDDLRASAFGASLIGKRKLMEVSDWNGTLRATSTGSGSAACTVQIDRTRT